MPITSSAKKALRQNKRRKKQNTKKLDSIKKVVKNFRKALAAKNMTAANELLRASYKALDKAAKTGAIKRGAADRIKSRLAKSIH